MARVDILKQIMAKKMSIEEFSWNKIVPPGPLLRFLGMSEIAELNKIATSIRLSSKPKLKYQYIDNILVPKGFKKLASGTNRVVYKYLEDQSFVLKIAYDKVGMSDNPNEYQNQFKLMPFCTKMFDVSPCGTVALVERVEPITSREEFKAIAPSVFDMITTKLIGKYVLDDIGTRFFQNYGVRMGMGPVLLDYPYVFDIDGAKLHCNLVDPQTKEICGGYIDYDDGFNMLLCDKCKKQYFPEQLKKEVEGGNIIISKGDVHKMKLSIRRGRDIIERIETPNEVEAIPIPESNSSNSKIVIKGYDEFKKRHNPSVKMDNPLPDKAKGIKPDMHHDDKNNNISAKNYGGNNIDYNIFGDKPLRKDNKNFNKPKPASDKDYSYSTNNDFYEKEVSTEEKDDTVDNQKQSKFINKVEDESESVYTTESDTSSSNNAFEQALINAGIFPLDTDTTENKNSDDEDVADRIDENDVEVIVPNETATIPIGDDEIISEPIKVSDASYEALKEVYRKEGIEEEQEEKDEELEDEDWLLKMEDGDEVLEDNVYAIEELREEVYEDD